MSSGGITPEQVRKEVKHLISELTERELNEITDWALFVDDLGVDSLMAIRSMVALDKLYNIDIPEAEFNQIKNVNDAVHVVMRHLSGRAAAR